MENKYRVEETKFGKMVTIDDFTVAELLKVVDKEFPGVPLDELECFAIGSVLGVSISKKQATKKALDAVVAKDKKTWYGHDLSVLK